VLILAALWLGAVLVMLWLENSLVYQPTRADEEWLPPPADDVADVWLASADSTKIHGWWFPQPGDAGAVLVSHGNGGNLSHRRLLPADLRHVLKRGVLLYDYPGYGKSDGKPSEAGCYAAAAAAWQWLTEEKHIPIGRVVLLGESLGGGVATELATRHDHEALVLVKTFTSLPAAAKNLYPWLPTHTLMSNRFDNLAKLPRCPKPVFIAHGTADGLIPFAHAEALYAAAGDPKELYRLEGQDHNDQLTSEFHAALRKFLDHVHN
jgi:fermentation-respiration switch protein FrsA (DUF1100 family)